LPAESFGGEVYHGLDSIKKTMQLQNNKTLLFILDNK